MRDLGVNPKQTVYVGDAYDDFKMAEKAGVTFIGVSSDFANLNRNKLEYQIINLKEIPILFGIDRTK